MTFRSKWCAFVIMYEIVSSKIIMVIDSDKPLPKKWKFAGGTHDPGDYNPEHTVLREIEDEVPQVEFISDLVNIVEYDMGDHIKYFYFAKVKQTGKLEAISEEIDSVAKFTPSEIYEKIKTDNMVESHSRAWEEFEAAMVTA